MSTATSANQTPPRRRGPFRLAVIGGGPKAAALAAKAWVLQARNVADIRVTIFEPVGIGANWSGQSGYTDGAQRLCTVAERDVGYPYNRQFSSEVDTAMASTFSWTTYLHARPPGYANGYSDWVDAGRKPPTHAHFADYLRWVVARAAPQAQVVRQSVVAMAAEDQRWLFYASNAEGLVLPHMTRFDAVVVTGAGPARHLPSNLLLDQRLASGKIFDGRDFWQRLDAVRDCLKLAQQEQEVSADVVAIVGAGGTAAAILAWLVANGASDLPIHMVASQASLHTRVDSVFENQVFSDDAQWATLSPKSRRAFFDRLNRGVVWSTVMERVALANAFHMTDGRAEQIFVSSSNEVALKVLRGDGETITLNASMVIDCSGFDPWWFLSMMRYLPASTVELETARHEQWQREMLPNLQLRGALWNDYPPLHAPMVANEQGPGFGSLMVLGAMADRVLRPYCK